jgi:hypothetical protein
MVIKASTMDNKTITYVERVDCGDVHKCRRKPGIGAVRRHDKHSSKPTSTQSTGNIHGNNHEDGKH